MTSARTERTTSEESGSGVPGVTVLGIAGSLREGSYNRGLVRAARELAPEGVRIEPYDGLGGIPPFDEDEEVPPPEPVVELRDRVRRADALLFATPEYNHSVPGVLKNAVDWASRPYGEGALDGKLAAVVGASPSDFGAAWAQEDLKKVLEACGVEVLDEELPVSGAADRFDDRGRLEDAETRERLAEVVEALTRVAAPRLCG